jgi:hypothetical protein
MVVFILKSTTGGAYMLKAIFAFVFLVIPLPVFGGCLYGTEGNGQYIFEWTADSAGAVALAECTAPKALIGKTVQNCTPYPSATAQPTDQYDITVYVVTSTGAAIISGDSFWNLPNTGTSSSRMLLVWNAYATPVVTGQLGLSVANAGSGGAGKFACETK